MSGEQAIGEPLGGPTDLTTDVSFSPDGKRLVAGRFDGGTIVYDTATRRQALRIDGDSVVTAVAFHPDGKLIAVGTIDGKVRFFDREERGGRRLARSTSGSAAVWQVAFSPDGRLLAVAVDPNGVDGFYVQQRQGEVQLWDVDSRQSRRAGDRAGRRIGALRGLQPRTARCWRPAATRAARPVGRGHPGPPRQADEGGGRRRPERRVRSERPARRRRRSDRAGAGVARGRSAAGLSAPRRPHRPRHRGGVRPGRLVPRDHERCSAGPGCGIRRRVSATATSWSGARGPARSTPTVDLPFLGLRNAFSPDGKLLAVAGVDDTRDAVGRRPGGLAPARLRDRGPKPEPRGVEALPAAGDALSRDVLGVAHRLKRSFGRRDPCRTVRNCSLRATDVGRPGDRARRSSAAPCLPDAESDLDRRCAMRLNRRFALAAARPGRAGRLFRCARRRRSGRDVQDDDHELGPAQREVGSSCSPRAAPTRWR